MSIKRKIKVSFLNNFLALKDFFQTKSSLKIIYLFYSSKIKKSQSPLSGLNIISDLMQGK